MNNGTTEDKQLAEFFHQFPSRSYPSGKDIASFGSEPAGVYLIETGHIRKYDINAKNGLEFTAHVYGPGSLFPLAWAIADLPITYFYASMGEVTVRIAPRKELRQFLVRNPRVSVLLCKRMLQGLNGMTARIKYLSLGDARQRIYDELLFMATQLGVQKGRNIHIAHSFTHQDIANLTGLTRETVSHIMEQLHSEGLLSDEKQHIVIHRLSKLTKLASL